MPVATMPNWLEIFAQNQPITPMIDAVRALTLGGAGYFLTRALLWAAAIVAVFAPIAILR